MFQNGRDAVPQQQTLHSVMDPSIVLLEVVTHYGKRVVRPNVIANDGTRDGEEYYLDTDDTGEVCIRLEPRPDVGELIFSERLALLMR